MDSWMNRGSSPQDAFSIYTVAITISILQKSAISWLPWFEGLALILCCNILIRPINISHFPVTQILLFQILVASFCWDGVHAVLGEVQKKAIDTYFGADNPIDEKPRDRLHACMYGLPFSVVLNRFPTRAALAQWKKKVPTRTSQRLSKSDGQ